MTTHENVVYYSRNNFDLIRLIAAVQVFLAHSIIHLELTDLSGFTTAISYFPGVPSFFFVSGFLISAAWERNPDPKVFYLNRALRVFPALWLVVAGSLVTIVVFLGSGSVSDNALGIIIWTIAQATYIQFWNPDMFREYGVGVVNGSLWTIHVELTFYAVLPVMYRLFKSIKADVLLIAVVVVSFAVNYSVVNWNADNSSEEFFQKVLNISAVPWVGMFALGMLAQFHKEILHRLLAGRFLWVLVVFLGISWLTESTRIFPLLDRGNSMGIINYLTVITLIFSAAYSGRSFSDKILKRNDFSYSIYLAHMPIVNVLVQHQIVGYKGFLILAPALLLFSIASWFLVEKRILATRRRALYRR